MERPVIAIMYDFDKTLCTKDMQDYGFIPSLDITLLARDIVSASAKGDAEPSISQPNWWNSRSLPF